MVTASILTWTLCDFEDWDVIGQGKASLNLSKC